MTGRIETSFNLFLRSMSVNNIISTALTPGVFQVHTRGTSLRTIIYHSQLYICCRTLLLVLGRLRFTFKIPLYIIVY